jgi:PAS domain-containing protein
MQNILNVVGDRWTFEPYTCTVTELYVNPAYCRMTGLPVEELLARVARRDMPARLGRLDHLCLFIDSLHAQLRDEEDVQYLPWQVGDETGLLVVIREGSNATIAPSSATIRPSDEDKQISRLYFGVVWTSLE